MRGVLLTSTTKAINWGIEGLAGRFITVMTSKPKQRYTPKWTTFHEKEAQTSDVLSKANATPVKTRYRNRAGDGYGGAAEGEYSKGGDARGGDAKAQHAGGGVARGGDGIGDYSVGGDALGGTATAREGKGGAGEGGHGVALSSRGGNGKGGFARAPRAEGGIGRGGHAFGRDTMGGNGFGGDAFNVGALGGVGEGGDGYSDDESRESNDEGGKVLGGNHVDNNNLIELRKRRLARLAAA